MDLIEQLGGYSQAKALLALPAATYDCGTKFSREDLERSMLEYRRANNIYEVGDKVVFTDKYSNNILLTITELTCSYAFTSMEFGEISTDSARHATDAEIEAKRRLDL